MGLFSETIPTAKFNQIGDKVVGTIVRFDQQQRTEFTPNQQGAGRPMFWHNGKPTAAMPNDPQTGEPNQPVMDKVIVLDTGVDDGYGETQRRLFVKSKQMLNDIKTACTAAGVRDVDEGGRLTCTWVDGAGRVGSPKVYAFEYAPPAMAGAVAAPAEAPAAPKAAKKSQDNPPF
ncbi:hypothetical protein ABZ388_06890 [Micromonospora parva]|uniref:hypothetical protein n=1 Tax=Micromonospora parva TaxID=1464048 RepID=UPI0033FA3523